MRILMVLGRATGGIGAHVDRLVADLRALGHHVEIVTADSTASAFGWSDAHQLWPVHSGLRAPTGLVDWHRTMRLAGTVDVVHAHGHQAAVVAAVAVARARPRPKLFVSLHNDLPSVAPPPAPFAAPFTAAAPPPGRPAPAVSTARSKAGSTGLSEAGSKGLSKAGSTVGSAAARGLLRWSLRQAQLVTGASSDLVDLAVRLGARRTELALVPSPAVGDLLHREPLDPVRRERLLASAGLPTDEPLVLSVARIASQKDLPMLLSAARRSAVPATWALVGDGDEQLRAHLEEEADGIRRGEGAARVHLVGARSDVRDWLRAADVFVLTSRWEARALVVQEAMAAGLPVVATRTGGLPELLGDTGALVTVGDSVALAAEVDALLGDATARRRMGLAARSRAATWPSPEDEARRWVERYAADPPGMT